MYFATIDIKGKNINTQQGYVLPKHWQGVNKVQALTAQFGPCTVYIHQEDLFLEHLLKIKNKGDSTDDNKKDIDKTTRGRRVSRNRAT